MITDAFVQEDGLAYDADSITVKLNKEDVTKDCKITVDGNKFKIETGKNITDEDKIEVTYNVTFSKEGNTQTLQLLHLTTLMKIRQQTSLK